MYLVYSLATIFSIAFVETAPQTSPNGQPQGTSNIENALNPPDVNNNNNSNSQGNVATENSVPNAATIPNSRESNPPLMPFLQGDSPYVPRMNGPRNSFPNGNQPYLPNYPPAPVSGFNGNAIASGNPIADFMNFIRTLVQPFWQAFTPNYR